MTDVLGVCESWADGVMVVRREQGDLVTIATADIVSGKPVPPRPIAAPPPRRRPRPTGWPCPGGSRSRASRSASGCCAPRAGSPRAATRCSPSAIPGCRSPEAVEHVAGWYRTRGLQPRAHVHLDGAGGGRLRRRRLGELRPDPADAGRGVPGAAPARPGHRRRGASSDSEVDAAWLASDERAARYGDPAQAGPRGRRGHLRDGAGRRRHGARPRPRRLPRRLGRGLLAVDPRGRASYRAWAARCSARSWSGAPSAARRRPTSRWSLANIAAQELYEAHGYEVHHRYDYLVADLAP